MLIVGEEEERTQTVSVRRHGQEGKGNVSVTIEEFAKMVADEVAKTLKSF